MAIREVIEQSMRQRGMGGQIRQAEPVIADLERAENQVVQNLIQFATGQGLSRADAERALANAGLGVRQGYGQQAQPQGYGGFGQQAQGEDLNAVVTRLAGTVDQLVEFARQNGYRG